MALNRPTRFASASCLLVLACRLVRGIAAARARAAAPTAAVAMGDSEISGEGAGSYEGNTNGPNNYCHRSANAWIKKISIGVSTGINLACSGAATANLAIGGPGQYGQESQADQLANVARSYTDR